MIVTILRWALAIGFIIVGIDKLRPSSIWPAFFEQLWLGEPLRYLTAAMQIAGGILLMRLRTHRIGLVVLGLTMVGAMGTWFIVLGDPSGAVTPAVMMGALVVVGFLGSWRSTTR